MDLKGRHLLKLLDFTPEEILYLVDHADELKAKKKQGITTLNHPGKNIALIFEKNSTRTRCSFEVAANDLGMHTTFLDPSASQIGKKESIADTARVLGRIYDGIEYRGFDQSIVDDLAKYAGVPVWNGLTNQFHPTQVLADIMTIREKFGYLKGIKMTYMGDARYNMGNSLMVVCAKMGMHFTACTCKEYFPDADIVAQCEAIAKETGGSITLTEDVEAGTKGADVIYTDVWVSMGEPDEVWAKRIKELSPYQVNKKVMENAGEKAIFMHCLPAFHDLKTTIGKEIGEKFGISEMEVTDEVFESAQSIGNAFVPGYFLTENELVLIDSGPIQSKRLMEMLDERHWRVRAVIHTHVHIDHVANDLLLLEKFPDILFYTSKDEADAIASPEDMMRSMGFDTAAHAKEAQAVYYPEKLHIIGVDMKQPEIMIDGEIFELISLEGHSVGHVGVVTPDGICCLGDAIVSEDVLNVSKLPYMANVQKSLASMEKVRSLNYEIYVIAHQSVEKKASMDKIVTDNIAKEHQLSRIALEVLTRPMTREEVLAKYMKTLHINQREGLSMVIIAHSAWTRYIDLMAQGRIVYREGLLFRKDGSDTAQI